jgi:hypothetical protein
VVLCAFESALDHAWIWISAPSRLGMVPQFGLDGCSLWRFGHWSRLWPACGFGAALSDALVWPCGLTSILWMLCGGFEHLGRLWITLRLGEAIPHALVWCLSSATSLWALSAALWTIGSVFGSPLVLHQCFCTPCLPWIALGLVLPHALVSAAVLASIPWSLFVALWAFKSASDCTWISAPSHLGRVLQSGLVSLAALCGALGFRLSLGSRLDSDQRSLTPWNCVAVWP